MTDFPHEYAVAAGASAEGPVSLETDGVAALVTAPPTTFGGPGDRWSPETLLVGAVANCFVLSFRAIARASRYEWHALDCRAVGTLDRVERITRFTQLVVNATLRVPTGSDEAMARSLLEQTERNCLITNSLSAACRLEASVETAGAPR
jgi:organic hydroperoxide reductase OsmC/OhrA